METKPIKEKVFGIFSKILRKNKYELQLFDPTKEYPEIREVTGVQACAGIQEYCYKFNFKINQSVLIKAEDFCRNIDFGKLREKLNSDLATSEKVNFNSVGNQDLFYMLLLAYSYTYNKDKIDLKDFVTTNKVVYSQLTTKIKPVSLDHVLKNYNFVTSSRMIYGLFMELLEQKKIISVEHGIKALQIKNMDFYRVFIAILNSYITWIKDLNNPQLRYNELIKEGKTPEDAQKLSFQAFPTMTYTNHSRAANELHPLFFLLNGYFTYPRYKSLQIPIGICDVYWYDDNTELSIIELINNMSNQHWHTLLTFITYCINALDLEAYQETINNFHRVFVPKKDIFFDNKWKLVTSISKLPPEFHTPAPLLLCRRGTQILSLKDTYSAYQADRQLHRAPQNVVNKEKFARLSRFGEYNDYAIDAGYEPTTEEFNEWLDSGLPVEKFFQNKYD